MKKPSQLSINCYTKVFQCLICFFSAPLSWSWGWRPRWGSARERWPSGSCWGRWATGSSPSAASASWTWRGFAPPAPRPPGTRPTRWRESPRRSSSAASRGWWGSCRSSPFCSPGRGHRHTRAPVLREIFLFHCVVLWQCCPVLLANQLPRTTTSRVKPHFNIGLLAINRLINCCLWIWLITFNLLQLIKHFYMGG